MSPVKTRVSPDRTGVTPVRSDPVNGPAAPAFAGGLFSRLVPGTPVLILITGLHGALLWLLVQAGEATEKPVLVHTISAEFIIPDPVQPVAVTPRPKPKPRVEPKPKPRPKPKPKPRPEPVPIAAPVEAPPVETAISMPEPPEPEPVAEPEPAPVRIIPPEDARHLNNPKPRYPSVSQRLGEEGTVVLRLLVLADGSVGKVELVRSSGYARLDRAAIKTSRKYRLVPARRNDVAIDQWYEKPFEFKLPRR